MAFTFNEDEAIAGSNVGGGFIKESGAHTGSFSEAYEVISKGGAIGIYLNFLSDNGQQATLTLWHTSKDGNPIEFTHRKIQSLMGILDIKTIREKKNTPIKKWDFNVKGMVDDRATSYPDIENKHVGVFFEARENVYEGKTSIRPEIIAFFDPETQQTYAEKAKNIDATAIDGLIERTPKAIAAPNAASLSSNNAVNLSSGLSKPPIVDSSNDDDDDGIPF